MTEENNGYSTDDPPIATAEPVPTPSAEEYQRLLSDFSNLRQQMQSEVTGLREQMESREASFRNEIVRERRRREIMEETLRNEFHQTNGKEYKAPGSDDDEITPMFSERSTRHVDEEQPRQQPGYAGSGLTLNPTSLNPNMNKQKFTAISRMKKNFSSRSIQDSGNQSDDEVGPAGDIVPTERNRDDEVVGTDIPLLPQDTFSFLAFSKYTSFSLAISLFVIGVQMLTLTVLAVDMFNEGEPGNALNIPKGINQSTATIQVVAIFIITVAQTDLHDSLNTLYIGFQEYDLNEAIGRPVNKWRWGYSLWVRIGITLYALGVTFIMIITESDTTQVLLDFTSIEFITNLDNIFFWLCAYGFMGFGPQKDATIVLNAKPSTVVLRLPEEGGRKNRHSMIRSAGSQLGITKENRKFPRLLFTTSLFVFMMTLWAIVFNWIRDGEFLCQTIFVQFPDEANTDLAPFSGLYDIGCSDQVGNCRRVKYGESFEETAKFAYCVEKASWGFTFGNETGDVLAGKTSPCNWMVHSKQVNSKLQDSYDIMSTASDPWKVLNRRQIDVPFEGFELKCFDCQHVPGFCGGSARGDCVNNRCVCKNGWYGRRCEFTPPCELIEFTDPELDNIDGRKFATQYNRMYNEFGIPVEIYDRPVYEGIIGDSADPESTNLVFFNGNGTGTLLKSEDFHGYWSAKKEEYKVDFYSDAVKVDSPEDATSPEGLNWYYPKPKQRGKYVEGVDFAAEAPFKFLCATCDDETNPCLYDGICKSESKSCDCTNNGASGRLCQILPIGNGRCDSYFNDKEHAWDGGDCCEETCVSTDEHICGRDVVVDSEGVETSEFVGFNNCRDTSIARSISGSRTIYEIVQRGVLRCGTIFTTKWFYNFMADQCRAVAAAVLDDPNAIQLFNFTFNRFTGLRDGRFDIVFWTDYTASRDVYETSAQTGFSYATVPYYFGGFVFAGIKPYGQCADRADFFSAQCLDMKICLVGGTTWFDTAAEIFPSQAVVAYNDFESTIVALENNECNVIGGTQIDVELISIRELGFTGDAANYEVGSKLYFKSFETWITREDDRVWSRFTSWIFESLVQAEESNITQTTSSLMGTTDVFGDDFSQMFKQAVKAVGNYGEMWNRNLPFKRSGMNLINDGSSPGMISYDFGRVSDAGPEPSRNGVIRTIRDRGTLRCGVVGQTPGLTVYDETTRVWSGLEMDLCRGMAAALFDGDDSKMVVTEITVATLFAKVASGDVDFVPGATRTLTREVKFGANGDAFDFSPPYFHDGMIFAGEMPYAACAENQVFTFTNRLGVDCTGTKICVPSGSSWHNTLMNKLRIEEDFLLLTTNPADSLQLHLAGACNVVVGEIARMNKRTLEAAGYVLTENYYFGIKKFSKEPICLMHRSDDPQFTDLVKWIMFGFYYAEEKGITNVNFFDMPETNLFGPDLTKIWQHSIRRVGNFAQIYDRNMGDALPRSGMNLLNNLSSPQLFAAPGTV